MMISKKKVTAGVLSAVLLMYMSMSVTWGQGYDANMENQAYNGQGMISNEQREGALTEIPSMVETNCDAVEAIISDKDQGKSIDVKAGTLFQIKLPQNVSTGYTWSIGQLDTAYFQLIDEQTELENLSGKLGAPSVKVYTFRTLHHGASELKLIYSRPWEVGSTPASTFVVDINIQ